MPKLNFFDRTTNCHEVGGQKIFFTECGHVYAKIVRCDYWGNERTLTCKDEFIQTIDGAHRAEAECGRCRFEKLKSAAIRCALCGVGIIPGDAVALYDKTSGGINKEFATYLGDSVLGCVLQGCGLAAALAGKWTFNGFEPYDFGAFRLRK